MPRQDDAGALDFALPLNGNPPPGRYHLTANDVSSGFVATADVVLSSASAPVLEIGTTKLLFLAAQGSQQSQSQTFRLRNRGSGTMRWHTNATTASGGGWLSADAGEAFAFSDGLQDRSVFVNPTGLAAGAYDGTILVAADGTDNVPQTIAVHLTVVGVGQATASVTPAFSLASQLAQLTVRGSGFLPNEAVDLSGGGFPPDRVLADVTGRVSVTRPNGIDPGRYDVQLRGVASGLTASATFRRQRWSLGPAAALQGSSANANFSLSGMLPGEAITLSAAPAGLTAPVIVTADGDGNAQGTFVTDGSAPTGAYTLRAQGSLSGADGAQQQMFSVIQLSASQLQWAASDTKPQLQVNGQGYAPFEWLDVQPRASGPRACGGALPFSDLTLQADASGAFNASPQVDPLTCSGAYAIYVRGHTSAVTLATSVYQTEMDYRYPDNPSVPVRLISPRQATPILVAGFGFGSGERITLSGDTSVLGATSATAGPWGDFQVSVTVSADPGSYSLTARGETTGFRSGPRVLHVGTTGVTPAQ